MDTLTTSSYSEYQAWRTPPLLPCAVCGELPTLFGPYPTGEVWIACKSHHMGGRWHCKEAYQKWNDAVEKERTKI